ncbi:MAG: cobalt-precorrin-5B (C(1))-methyltransferase [Rhizobiaceae bacterium]|nr:cobalt-precorrin-5B (C(1))-methyltransferase [Hyphomicrobiales bacterium]NRB30998.1 cobalt-precorrin-5B (C(1))-methyltransferase [Rhizobiaceae bacterium]
MEDARQPKPETELRRGWTTGACATAATKAALTALITGEFPDPVEITLPKGETPQFPLCYEALNNGGALAGIVKDAGDDPDVTHGATIISHVVPLPEGSGIVFKAGQGVGTVTKAGLPIEPNEAAINPVPRQMMQDVVAEICAEHMLPADLQITISVPGGEELAKQTWNPRLGIVGGISILGTTGIVHPFSCSAWIHSIHRGIDVARAAKFDRVIGATGSTSEKAAQDLYQLPETALLDMGDFAGGLLKYLRQHPLPNITIAGGFAKLTKLAQGALDLHSGRSQVDFQFLLEQIESLLEEELNQDLKQQILSANTAAHVLAMTRELDIDLPGKIAQLAQKTALQVLREAPVAVEILVVDRGGEILARV